MKKTSVLAILILSFCFYSGVQAQQGSWPPARPEQNHPVDLEVFILK
jgi:hypothetical protein